VHTYQQKDFSKRNKKRDNLKSNSAKLGYINLDTEKRRSQNLELQEEVLFDVTDNQEKDTSHIFRKFFSTNRTPVPMDSLNNSLWNKNDPGSASLNPISDLSKNKDLTSEIKQEVDQVNSIVIVLGIDRNRSERSGNHKSETT